MDDLKILQQILNKLDKIDKLDNKLDKIENQLNTMDTRLKNVELDIKDMKFDIKDIKANQDDIITEISTLYSISNDIQVEVKKTNSKLDKVIELNDLKI